MNMLLIASEQDMENECLFVRDQSGSRSDFEKQVNLIQATNFEMRIVRARVMREVMETIHPTPPLVQTVELDSDIWETVADETGMPLDTAHWSSRELLAFQSKNTGRNTNWNT